MSYSLSRERLEQALARIDDPAGEGARTCLTVYRDTAQAAADAADARAKHGISLGPLDGAIVTVKDLFDIKGEPTRAGSRTLADAPPAESDAPVVQRLRAAGAVIVAKTNMTEFAFSGVGANPHYGTPGNPADRSRVPGGSSSGAAVAAADGMCEIAVGTDTGGSTRIPAALCGVVGFKPSKWRIPTDGAFPLSYTLDSVGPLARSVEHCAKADAVMSNEPWRPLEAASLEGLRLADPQSARFLPREPAVETAMTAGLTALAKAGAAVKEVPFPFLDDMIAANPRGGFPVPEAFSIHRERLATRGHEIDPNVRDRILGGEKILAADYIALIQIRNRLVRATDEWLRAFDALILPTTPIAAPRLADLSTTETYIPANTALLSITSIGNFLDLCAISLPLPTSGLPVGMMLMARNGSDRRLFEIAAGIERILKS
jgi:aspartyl-tRNA(Asn)/glutamyl-tRNA(Gln) amidotransferase subunit A